MELTILLRVFMAADPLRWSGGKETGCSKVVDVMLTLIESISKICIGGDGASSNSVMLAPLTACAVAIWSMARETGDYHASQVLDQDAVCKERRMF
jgi:hypothetical protein